MKAPDDMYIRLIGTLNRALSALKVLNCSCHEDYWPVFTKYCKITKASEEKILKDVILSSFDWEGYRQRLDVAVTLEKYKKTIWECNIASGKYETFIEDMIGRDGETVEHELSSALLEFSHKIVSPQAHLSLYYETWWHFCSRRHCILDGRCMFFVAEDLLPILLIPDSAVDSLVGKKLKNIKNTLKDALIPFLVDNYNKSAGGWTSYFDPCIAEYDHDQLTDGHWGEVNIEISAAVLTYLFRSRSMIKFAENLSQSIDQIVNCWLDNIEGCRSDGDESLFFSWYTHPTKAKISIKNETISATIGIGLSLLSLLSSDNDGLFAAETVLRMQENLKDIIAFVKQKATGLTLSKSLYCWSSGRDSYLAKIPITDIKPIIMVMEFFLELLRTPNGKVYDYSERRKIDALVSKLAELLVSKNLESGLWPVLDNEKEYLHSHLFEEFHPKKWDVGTKPNLSLNNSINAISVLARYLDQSRIQCGEIVSPEVKAHEYLIFCVDLRDSTKYKHRVPSVRFWGPIEYQLKWMREWLDKYSPIYLNFTGDGYLALIRAEDAALDEMTGNSELSIGHLINQLIMLRDQHLIKGVFNTPPPGRSRADHDKMVKEIKNYENILCTRVSLHINVDQFRAPEGQYIGPDLDLCCRLNNPKWEDPKYSEEIQSISNPVFVSGLLVDAKRQFQDRAKPLGRMDAKGIEFPGSEGSDWQEKFTEVYLYKFDGDKNK